MKTEDKEHREERNDEIDLIQLFKEIGSWFRSIFVSVFVSVYVISSKIFMTILYFGLRNYIYLAVLTIVAFSISRIPFKSSLFESTMKVQCNAVDNQSAIEYVNKLSILAAGNKDTLLAKQLKIDVKDAGLIKELNACWALDKDGDGIGDWIDYKHVYVREETDSMSRRIYDYFIIRVVYDPGLDITKLNNSIKYYLNHNDVFMELNQFRKQQNNKKIVFTKEELSKLDSIRNMYNDAIAHSVEPPPSVSKSGQLVFLNGRESELKNLRLFHGEIFSLEDKILSLERQNELNAEVVTVLERLDLAQKRVKRIYDYLGVLFFIFGFVAIIVFENRKRIVRLKEEADSVVIE